MFFSSSGLPNWHHPTATSPSKTSAAWARSSRTSRSLSARLASYENSFSAWKVWNHVHQQPPHTPLCRSARPANASHVSGVRGRTVRVAAACSVTGRSLRETGPCQAQGALRNTGPGLSVGRPWSAPDGDLRLAFPVVELVLAREQRTPAVAARPEADLAAVGVVDDGQRAL